MEKRPKGDRRRSAALLAAAIGEERAITDRALAGRVTLHTTVRPSVRCRYIREYLAGCRTATPVWAYEIGDTVPLAWWTGALGLWNFGCFNAFVWLLHRCVHLTTDDRMLSTCNELWHFIDALNYVAEPLAYDELPAIAVINVHPGAILAGLRIFQICAEIEAVSHDENEARAVTVSIMLRQLAKHTLRRTSDSLYPLFNEAWSTLRDCFYRNYGGAKEDDIADPIIEGRPRTACLTADTVTNVHLLSAHDRARNALGDVNIRARLILNDLRAWITDIYRDVGGDIDMLAPLETPSCRQILAGLLADYM